MSDQSRDRDPEPQDLLQISWSGTRRYAEVGLTDHDRAYTAWTGYMDGAERAAFAARLRALAAELVKEGAV